jgi:hypothetical protein
MEGSTMITITGLTEKQKALMTVMWDMDDMSKVTAFVSTLPKRDAQDCMSLIEIAIQLTYEQQGELDAYKDHACAVINAARSV